MKKAGPFKSPSHVGLRFYPGDSENLRGQALEASYHSQVTEREPALSGRQRWKPECAFQANLPRPGSM